MLREIAYWVSIGVAWLAAILHFRSYVKVKYQLKMLAKMETMYDVYFKEMKVILKGVANENND